MAFAFQTGEQLLFRYGMGKIILLVRDYSGRYFCGCATACDVLLSGSSKQYRELVLIASFSLYSIIEAHAVSVFGKELCVFLMGMYLSVILQVKERFGNNESVW